MIIMTPINFTKMHVLGNDFMVIDNTHNHYSITPEKVVLWGNRNTGIGFDQCLIIEPSAKYDFFYRIFNADGSEVGQCGNGARALGAFILQHKLSTKTSLQLETKTTVLRLELGNPHAGSMDPAHKARDDVSCARDDMSCAQDDVGSARYNVGSARYNVGSAQDDVGCAQDSSSSSKVPSSRGLSAGSMDPAHKARDDMSCARDDMSCARDDMSCAQDDVGCAQDEVFIFDYINLIIPAAKITPYTITLPQLTYAAAYLVDVGNPHLVIFDSNISVNEIISYSKDIHKIAEFSAGININFANIVDNNINLIVYERGVGLTKACGSGAAATAAAGFLYQGLGSKIKVIQPGGEMSVEILEPKHEIQISGPVTFVYQGVIPFPYCKSIGYEETAYLMSSAKNTERLNQSIAEIEAGKYTQHGLVEE
jgi:diaminopimelate epimerase